MVWRSEIVSGMVYFLNIHIIGDSHCGVFTRQIDGKDAEFPPFVTHYIAGATAFHLKDSQSSSNSKVSLDSALNLVKPDDIVLLWFGEIDCRLHLAQKSKEKGIPIEKLLDETILSYAQVLKMVNDRGFKWGVIGMPPCNREGGFPDDEKKKIIYYGFNDRLKKFCVENNYKYIDVQEFAADEKGFIRPEFLRSTDCQWFWLERQTFNHDPTSDKVHLNHKIIPHVIEQINTLFNTKLYIEIKGYE